VEDGDYLNASEFQPINDDVGCARNYELAGAFHPSGTAFSGKQAETLNRFENPIELTIGGGNAICGDVPVDFPRFRFGQWCPLDLCGQFQSGYQARFPDFRAAAGFV
jgi:hypothetical protein